VIRSEARESGSQLVAICHQLKMTASDGKQRLTGAAITEGRLART
jgi:hypothetical protein